MFIILPIVWIAAWLLVAGLVAGFSGLNSHGEGLVLFLVILLGGGIGLPVIGGLGWLVSRRLRQQ